MSVGVNRRISLVTTEFLHCYWTELSHFEIHTALADNLQRRLREREKEREEKTQMQNNMIASALFRIVRL